MLIKLRRVCSNPTLLILTTVVEEAIAREELELDGQGMVCVDTKSTELGIHLTVLCEPLYHLERIVSEERANPK
jgi:hypothetical protein